MANYRQCGHAGCMARPTLLFAWEVYDPEFHGQTHDCCGNHPGHERLPDAVLGEVLWERCTGLCGREYAFPHLCREHMLCGLCHPPVQRPAQ